MNSKYVCLQLLAMEAHKGHPFLYQICPSFPGSHVRLQNRSLVSNVLLQLKFETSFPGWKLLFRKRSFDPEKEVLSLSGNNKSAKKRRSWKQSFEFELCNIKLGTRFRFPTQSLDPETKDKKQITLLCFYS